MSEFLLLFRGGDAGMAAMSPEELQADMARWHQWIGGLAEQGGTVNSEPLLPSGKTIAGISKLVTDGPFMEGKEMVGGYLLFQAASLDEATELALGCPILQFEDGNVEVREVMKM